MLCNGTCKIKKSDFFRYDTGLKYFKTSAEVVAAPDYDTRALEFVKDNFDVEEIEKAKAMEEKKINVFLSINSFIFETKFIF